MIDLNTLGGVLAGIGALATGAWAWWLKNRRQTAETRAEVAEARASEAVADAQRNVYTLLNERLTTLEQEVRGLRQELAAERAHSRKLEMQIMRLDRWIRAQGLTPPTFSEDAMKVGGTD